MHNDIDRSVLARRILPTSMIGLLLGAQIGFYWIKHNPNAVVTITPQFSYDGSNWLGFFTVGFSYDF